MTLGAAYMYVAGAPSRYILVNLAGLAIGVVASPLIRLLAGRQHVGGAFTIIAALALLATGLLGPHVDGASRWIRIAGLSLQPSLLLLPLTLMLFARRQDWLSSIGLALAGVALALQPDRAMAGTLAGGLAVLWLYRRNAMVTVSLLMASGGFVSTLVGSDIVPAVPFVERVAQSAFAFHPLAGLAIVAAFAIMLAPAVAGIVSRRGDAAVFAAFGATWLLVIAFAIVGNYPTPLAGYGTSSIVGYCLSAAMLTALPGAGDSWA